MDIRSKLFSKNPVISKHFEEDIRTISKAGIDAHLQQELAAATAEFYLAPTSKTEVTAIETIRSKWPASAEVLRLFLSIGSFFLKEMDETDTSEAIASDLVGLHIAEQQDADAVTPFIEGIIRHFKETVLERKRNLETQQFGPRIVRALTCRADLRGVIRELEDTDEESDDKQADPARPPEIANLVPVGIIHLRLSGDDNLEVVFQVDYRTLDLVRKELDRLHAQMDALVKYVEGDKVHVHRGRTVEDE